jgi:predicted membrane protein (TIGR00267 family)
MISSSLQRRLLLDELADLRLYEALRVHATAELATVLDVFIVTEKRHAAFWRNQFHLEENEPDWRGHLRNTVLKTIIALLGTRTAFLILEAVEVHGIKKYLSLWQRVKEPEIREGLRSILTDEFLHEDEALTGAKGHAMSPDVIRNAFLGFNDGSVEILGAVSGLAAALHDARLVTIAGLTVSVAGALSMAAGAFLSTHSEHELRQNDQEKKRFLEQTNEDRENHPSPLRAGALVGIAYLIGASVPVAPFFFGVTEPYWSILLSGMLILLVSSALAFLSGMNIRRRVGLNMLVIVCAVTISYLVGRFAEATFGIRS